MADNQTGWYLGVEGGVNRTNDTGANFVTDAEVAPFSSPVDMSFHDGWVGFGTAGYAFPGNWRMEAELGYRHNKISSITPAFVDGPFSSRGQINTASLMGNLIYDIPITQRFKASLGAGAGVVHRDFNDKFLVKDHDMKFAYQGIAGLSYAISPGTDITMNYRYLRSAGGNFHEQNGSTRDAYLTDNIDDQAITIGLRFDLHPDAVRETYVAPLAEPAPQPVRETAAPPAPRQFLVFFGFNKSNLTSDAEGVVSNAAQTAKQTGSASLVIVGHADTVGSDHYNQNLSERRAAAVRTALEAQGIDAGKITASGLGETSLLVQTGDNVKEPQNRRATIDLQ
jgi:outer membrane protein OmpA-like peptidoglycan-associated protein